MFILYEYHPNVQITVSFSCLSFYVLEVSLISLRLKIFIFCVNMHIIYFFLVIFTI